MKSYQIHLRDYLSSLQSRKKAIQLNATRTKKKNIEVVVILRQSCFVCAEISENSDLRLAKYKLDLPALFWISGFCMKQRQRETEVIFTCWSPSTFISVNKKWSECISLLLLHQFRQFHFSLQFILLPAFDNSADKHKGENSQCISSLQIGKNGTRICHLKDSSFCNAWFVQLLKILFLPY